MSDTSESTGSLDWAIVDPHGDLPDDDATSTASSVEVVDEEEDEEGSFDGHMTPLAGSPNNNMPKFVLRLPSQSACTQSVSDTDDEQSDVSTSVHNAETSMVPESLPSSTVPSTSSSDRSMTGQTYRQASPNVRISQEDLEDLCNTIDTLKKSLVPNKNVDDITPDDLFGDGHPGRSGQSHEQANNLPRRVENLCPSECLDGETSMQSSISSSYSFLSRDTATEMQANLMEDTENKGPEPMLVEQLLTGQEPITQNVNTREPAADEQKGEPENRNVGQEQNNHRPSEIRVKCVSNGFSQVPTWLIGVLDICLIGIGVGIGIWISTGPLTPDGSECLGNMCYTGGQYKDIMDSLDDNDSRHKEMQDTIRKITETYGHKQGMEKTWEDTYQIKLQLTLLASMYRDTLKSQTDTERTDNMVKKVKKQVVSEQVEGNSDIDESKVKCINDLDSVRGQCQNDLEKVKGQCQRECNKDMDEINEKCRTDIDSVRSQCQTDLDEVKSQCVHIKDFNIVKGQFLTDLGQCQHDLDKSRNQHQMDLDSVKGQYQTDLDKVKGQCQHDLEKSRNQYHIDLDSIRGQCQTDLDNLKHQYQVQMAQVKRESDENVRIALKSCARKPADNDSTKGSRSGSQQEDNSSHGKTKYHDDRHRENDENTYNYENIFPKDINYTRLADTVLEMMNSTKYHIENTWAKVKNMSETVWQDTEPTISSLQETFRDELVRLNKFQQKISHKFKKWFNRKQAGAAKTKRRKFEKDDKKKSAGVHTANTVEQRIVALSYRVDNFSAKTFRKTYKKKIAVLESIQAEFKEIDAIKKIPRTYEEKIKWKDYILTDQHLKWLRCQQQFWEDFTKAPDTCYAELCCWQFKITDSDVKACRKYKRRHGMVEDQCFLELPRESVDTDDDGSEIHAQSSPPDQQHTADVEDNWYIEMGEHRDYQRNEPDDWFFRRKNKAQFDEQNKHKHELDDDLNDDDDDDDDEEYGGVDIDDDNDDVNHCYPNRCHFEP